MRYFTTTVNVAADAADAIARVAKRADQAGIAVTGRTTTVTVAGRTMFAVECELLGDANNAWVILTSYGMSPSTDLGSTWESAFSQ